MAVALREGDAQDDLLHAYEALLIWECSTSRERGRGQDAGQDILHVWGRVEGGQAYWVQERVEGRWETKRRRNWWC